jgi:hypothetical protein
MKKTTALALSLSALLFLSNASAEEKDTENKVKTQLTTADAKKKCKEEGKDGQALIDCIKEKKGDK